MWAEPILLPDDPQIGLVGYGDNKFEASHVLQLGVEVVAAGVELIVLALHLEHLIIGRAVVEGAKRKVLQHVIGTQAISLDPFGMFPL